MKDIIELLLANWFATILILGILVWGVVNIIRAFRGQEPT